MNHKAKSHYISEWRAGREMSQTELAHAIGVSPSNISQIESGRTGYTQASLEKIAVALRTTPARLLDEDPSQPMHPEDFMSPFIRDMIPILEKMGPATRKLVHDLISAAQDHEDLLHREAMKLEKRKNSGGKIILMKDELVHYKE